MTQITENVFAVEVPDNIVHAEIYEKESLPVAVMVYIEDKHKLFKPGIPFPIPLPPGSWQLLCMTREATEEQAVNIVQWSEWYFPVKHSRFIDYTKPYDTALKQKWGHGFGTAVESLRSLLTSKGLDENKNYALLKKG